MAHILIVEDEYDIAEQVMLFFKAAQFDVTHIADGADVVGWVAEHQPDAILMDIMAWNA